MNYRIVDVDCKSSTAIDKCEYNYSIENGTGALVITYSDNPDSSYVYYPVAMEMFDGLMQAESLGSYINTDVRPNTTALAIRS